MKIKWSYLREHDGLNWLNKSTDADRFSKALLYEISKWLSFEDITS